MKLLLAVCWASHLVGGAPMGGFGFLFGGVW